MNAATRNDDRLDMLTPFVDGVLADRPARNQSDAAQRRLMTRLDDAGRPAAAVPSGVRWRMAAAAAVLAVLGVTVLPFVPGGGGQLAFADVQRRFETFETLQAQLTTTVGGNAIQSMRILVDSEGRTRLDAGDQFSYVIDPASGAMLQLFHGPGRAVMLDLGAGGPVPEAARLGWLEDLRTFQGQADRIPEPRVIDGRQVTGFEFTTGGRRMVLWAAAGGEPVRLELPHGGGSDGETRIDFRFDRALPAGSFDLDVPAGYTLDDGPVDPA